jgi:hypothetical protein
LLVQPYRGFKYTIFHASHLLLADAPSPPAHGRVEVGGAGSTHQPAYVANSLTSLVAQQMFIQKFYDYDERKFPRGFYFNFLGLVRILKFNVATVMQKPDYIFIIEIFGREYILSSGAHQ